MRPDGTFVLVDPQEEIEAQRRHIREQMRFQAQRRLPAAAEIALGKIVQTSFADRIEDPPVTWFRLFGGDASPDDLMNPFAQDDHIPPTYPELYPGHPEQVDDGGQEEPESEANQHVKGDQR